MSDGNELPRATESAEQSLERVQAGIAVLVQLMFNLHNERLAAVAAKCAEIMAVRIQNVVAQPAAVQFAWAQQELAHVRDELQGLREIVPNAIRERMGSQIVDDHIAEVHEHVNAGIDAIVEKLSEQIDQTLPQMVAYRTGREMAEAIFSQPAPRPLFNWVIRLHTGQVAMLVVGAVIGAIAAALAAALEWFADAHGAAWILGIAAIWLAGFSAWSLWNWFGVGAARNHLRSNAAAGPAKV